MSKDEAKEALDAANSKLKEALQKQREYEEKVRQLQAEMEGLGYVKKQVKLVCRKLTFPLMDGRKSAK